MQLLWPYFRQIRGRDKDRAALPKMWGGDGILCDRRYCNGCAMYTEEIAPNHLIFHCNDYYNDDDLNDFVFTMEISRLEEK